jgi:hypothetical protein
MKRGARKSEYSVANDSVEQESRQAVAWVCGVGFVQAGTAVPPSLLQHRPHTSSAKGLTCDQIILQANRNAHTFLF